jgi:hypothetical protein
VKLNTEVLPLLLAIDIKFWMASKHKKGVLAHGTTARIRCHCIWQSGAKYNFLALTHIGSIKVSSHITMISHMEKIASAMHHVSSITFMNLVFYQNSSSSSLSSLSMYSSKGEESINIITSAKTQ